MGEDNTRAKKLLEQNFKKCHLTGWFYPENEFPRSCEKCQAKFPNREDYLNLTDVYDANEPFAELWAGFVHEFRKCKCGTTLTCILNNRRDLSEDGLAQRILFDEKLEELVESGLEREEARQMLLDKIKRLGRL